jgi:hypothetical protein
LLLIIIAIRNPCLHGGAVERAGHEPLMERVLVVVARLTDGAESRG